MNNVLFPDLAVEDYILEIKYDGPSFEGVMEINALGNEILALDVCFKKVISLLKSRGEEYEVVVEPFESGSFKKRTKLVVKWIEKNKTTATLSAGLIGVVITGAVQLILKYGPDKIAELSPQLISEIHDRTQISLLNDPVFLRNIAIIAQPLLTEGDKVILRKATNDTEREVVINYSQKNNFSSLTSVIEKTGDELTAYDEVYGKIILMDIDAIKNQIAFKVYGEGERIHCTLPSEMNINDYTYLLGKWVTISGQVTKRGEQILHIEIKAIIEDEDPAAEKVQSKIG